MNMPPKKSIATIKAKLQIAKTKNDVSINQFSEKNRVRKPNPIANNHDKNTVQQGLEALEERTYEAIDETSQESINRTDRPTVNISHTSR